MEATQLQVDVPQQQKWLGVLKLFLMPELRELGLHPTFYYDQYQRNVSRKIEFMLGQFCGTKTRQE